MLYASIVPEPTIQDFLIQEKLMDFYHIKTYYGQNAHLFLYKNPTIREWETSVPEYARGWISPEGDLYIEGYDTQLGKPDIIHYDLLKILEPLNVPGIRPGYAEGYWKGGGQYLYNVKTYGLLVQRQGQRNTLMFSESMVDSQSDKYGFFAIEEDASKIYGKMKQRHPDLHYLKCIYWSTGTPNDEEEADPWGRHS